MRRTPLLLLPLAILLAGCAGPSAGYQRVNGGSDAWGVSVTDPRVNSLGDCHEDPSVEIAALSADMPSSSYGLRLVPEATETGTLRLADCLADAGAGGRISISSPAD